MHVLQVAQQRRPVVPGHVLAALDHVVAVQGGDRDEGQVPDVELGGERGELGGDLLEHALVVADQVHLVHRQHQVRHPQQGGEEGVAPALLGQPVAGVHQDDRQVGGGRPGDHVPRVLDVPGGVGDDELAAGGGEVAVGHVDGDALLALGPQPVGEQGEVGVVLAPRPAGPLHRRELVLEDRLGVVQQPPDEGALAVVHRAGRGQPQDVAVPVPRPGACHGGALGCVGHQKYPSFLRSSIAASLVRSSARVWPRSVIRVAAISVMTSSSVAAADSTAPVQVMSPTVR